MQTRRLSASDATDSGAHEHARCAACHVGCDCADCVCIMLVSDSEDTRGREPSAQRCICSLRAHLWKEQAQQRIQVGWSLDAVQEGICHVGALLPACAAHPLHILGESAQHGDGTVISLSYGLGDDSKHAQIQDGVYGCACRCNITSGGQRISTSRASKPHSRD